MWALKSPGGKPLPRELPQASTSGSLPVLSVSGVVDCRGIMIKLYSGASRYTYIRTSRRQASRSPAVSDQPVWRAWA